MNVASLAYVPRRLLAAWLSLALFAAACTSTATSGEATLQDILNNVQVSGADGTLKIASTGTAVSIGTYVKSGENSLARLAFSAGPAVRLSSNTSFAMEQNPDGEEVRLRLEAGRLRMSLFGHLFGVDTALGLVQLGGFGEVLYQIGSNPDLGDDVLTFRCMSGPCRYQGETQRLQLDNLEMLVVSAGGQAITRTALSEIDLRQFIGDNPGSVGLIASLTAAPTRTNTPTPITPSPTPSNTSPPSTPTFTPTHTLTPTRTRVPFTPQPRLPSPTSAPVVITDTPTPQPDGGGGENPPPPTNTNPPPPPPPPTNTPIPPTNTPEPTATEAPTKTPTGSALETLPIIPALLP